MGLSFTIAEYINSIVKAQAPVISANAASVRNTDYVMQRQLSGVGSKTGSGEV